MEWQIEMMERGVDNVQNGLSQVNINMMEMVARAVNIDTLAGKWLSKAVENDSSRVDRHLSYLDCVL